jgi:hypothetical protein
MLRAREEDGEQPFRRWPAVGFGAVLLWVLVIYGPGIGHGFVKDDVAWVSANRISSLQDLQDLAHRSNGFYRPLVAASFAIDRAIYGIEPFGYGVTNLLLLIASAAALIWMARGVGLSPLAAVIASAIWICNFHGIHMAVLWLSGRTELWLVLCAFVSAGAVARRQPVVAGIAVFGALLAKEEAVMLPAMLAGWTVVLADCQSGARWYHRAYAVARRTWLTWIALGVYVVLRSRTAAYTPATSPWFYHFTFDPFRVITNAGEYLDRACTFSLIAVALCAVLAWSRPTLTPLVRRCLPLALIWLIGGYALTVFLPVRSSLYACLPSAGVTILAAAIVTSLPYQRRMLVAIAVPVLLLPVYWSRNERWVELADLGHDTFQMVRQIVRDTPSVSRIDFTDDRDTRRSLLNTYGALLPPAVALAAGRPIPVWLDPPPDDWQGSELVPPPVTPPTAGGSASAQPSRPPSAVVQLKDDRLVRLR